MNKLLLIQQLFQVLEDIITIKHPYNILTEEEVEAIEKLFVLKRCSHE